MRHFTIVLAGLAGLAVSTLAAKADDQSRLATARQIVMTTHSADNLRVLFPKLMQQMRPLLQNQGADASTIDAFITKFEQHADTEADRFVDLAAQIYAREFSDEDLQAMLTFYTSPAGQHFVAKQVEISQGLAEAGQQWGQVIAKDVISEFAKNKASAKDKL